MPFNIAHHLLLLFQILLFQFIKSRVASPAYITIQTKTLTRYSQYSDRELVRMLKNSDESAFTELYDRYWKKIYFIGANKLNDLTAVEESVQDIFCDLWERRLSLELKGEISAYLAVAIKYKVINILARRKRATEYEKQMLATLPQGVNSTEEWLSFEELKDRLAILIEQLPEKARLAFRLNKDEGCSHKEIASVMNISSKAVERNIARAVQTLATGLIGILTVSLHIPYALDALFFF